MLVAGSRFLGVNYRNVGNFLSLCELSVKKKEAFGPKTKILPDLHHKSKPFASSVV